MLPAVKSLYPYGGIEARKRTVPASRSVSVNQELGAFFLFGAPYACTAEVNMNICIYTYEFIDIDIYIKNTVGMTALFLVRNPIGVKYWTVGAEEDVECGVDAIRNIDVGGQGDDV